eukprot:scaffold59606_cov47-Prasinocladus_malaysianus.AAC.1
MMGVEDSDELGGRKSRRQASVPHDVAEQDRHALVLVCNHPLPGREPVDDRLGKDALQEITALLEADEVELTGDGGCQRLLVDGLGQHIVHSAGQVVACAPDLVGVHGAGDDDGHGGLRVELSDPSRGFGAGHAWHELIHDHQGGEAADTACDVDAVLEHLQGLLSALHLGDHCVGVPLEPGCHYVMLYGIVVNVKDFDFTGESVTVRLGSIVGYYRGVGRGGAAV